MKNTDCLSLVRLSSGSMSIHFRSRKRIGTRAHVKIGVGRGLAVATSFPEPLFSTLAARISSDVSVTYLLIPRYETKKQLCHKIKIRSISPPRNVLDDNRHSHQMLGRSSCFHGSTLSRVMIHHFEVNYTLDMILFQILKCVITSVLRETCIGAEFGQFLLFRKSCECLHKFKQQVSLYFGISLKIGSTQKKSVGVTIDSKFSSAAGFTTSRESLATSPHKSATSPLTLSEMTEIIARKSILLFLMRWQHGIQDVRFRQS